MAMNLIELGKELQNYRQLREQAASKQEETGWIDEIIADLVQQIGPNMDQIQKQLDDLEEIKLPTDYNEAFGDPRANGEIIGLIRQVKEQLYMDFNLQISQLYEEFNQKLATELQQAADASTKQLNQLQEIINVGQPENERLSKLVNDLQEELVQTKLDKRDANQTRDNAVQAKEEAEATADKLVKENASLKEQIDELEGLVRAYKKPSTTGGISLTTSLKPETDEEKAARLDKAKADLLNKNLVRFNVDPLPVKADAAVSADPKVTKDQLDAAFQGIQESSDVVSDNAGAEGVQQTAEDMEPAGDAKAAPTVDELHADVEMLKTQMQKVLNHLFV